VRLPSKMLAASLLVAGTAVTGTVQAAPIGAGSTALARAAQPAAQTVQWRHGGGWHGGWRGGHWGHRGFGWWGPAAGFAAGAVVGSALAAPGYYAYSPGYDYYDDTPGYVVGEAGPSGGSVAYCAQRFRSYDPASGTYLGYDGLRHPCP